MNVLNFATASVKTVIPSDSIDKAIAMMEEHDIHHLVVVSGHQPVGMVSDRDILISTGWMLMSERRSMEEGRSRARVLGPTRIEQIMSSPVTMIRERGSAMDAANLMLNRGIGALPILNGHHMVGILTEWDLIRWLDELAMGNNAAMRLLTREVNDVMTANVAAVAPSTPLGEIVRLFRQRRIRHVPVAVDSTLMGIISDRDVRRALGWLFVHDLQAEMAFPAESDRPAVAEDIMQPEVRTVELGGTLREALRVMLTHRVHSTPVVLGEQLLGMLTITDFVRVMAKEDVLSLEGLVCE